MHDEHVHNDTPAAILPHLRDLATVRNNKGPRCLKSFQGRHFVEVITTDVSEVDGGYHIRLTLRLRRLWSRPLLRRKMCARTMNVIIVLSVTSVLRFAHAKGATLILFDPADERFANSSCLDGTRYGIYIRNGSSPNADKWVSTHGFS